MTQLNEHQTAAALHGIATNSAYNTLTRLQAALQALQFYEQQARRVPRDTLNEAAAEWDRLADQFEAMDFLPADVHGERVVSRYRWGAALLRGRARRLELEELVD